MYNKRGSSNLLGFVATTLIVIAVILFRVINAVGPDAFGLGSILKYLAEMAAFAGAYAGCAAVGNSEKIKSPFSTVLIILIIAIAVYLIYKVWRI